MTAPAPRSILVVMLRRIGDVLLTTPAVRALRRAYPEARIDFLVEAPAHEALAGNPDVSEVLLYRSGALRELLRARARRYDWVVDFMGNPRTALLTAASGASVKAGPGHVAHRWAYTHRMPQSSEPCYSAIEKIRGLRALGVPADESDHLPSLRVSPEAEAFAARALPPGPLIGLAPASRRETRRWPAASYADLGRRLRDSSGARLVVFWGPGERELAARVAAGVGPDALIAPQASTLGELAALLGRCRLLVTNCSGTKHVAVARGVPTLTLHGSSDPRAWNPPASPAHAVARVEGLRCIACGLNRCPYSLECMTQLSAESVFPKAAALLGRAAGTEAR